MKVNGKIFNVNGTALRKDETAFIYQDDSFFSQISVRETLQLAASLRLFNETSQAAINEIIQFLSLDKVADNYVGDIVNRGISGGERKRLAVACELLGTSPALLIADEPSSGLDSFQATQVLQLLKKIAVEKNVAVVCTIHQPRSSIWNVFDDIMLLGPGGHVIYHGPRDQVVPYFAGIGYPCPKDTNPAEFLIDLVSSSDSQKSPSTNGRIEIEERSRLLAQEFTNTTEEGENLMLTAAQQVSQWQLQHVSEASIQKERFLMITPGRAIFRFALLLQRALRQTLRDNATNLVRIGTSTMLATIIGSIFGKSGGPGPLTSTAVSDKVTLIAHASINVAMLSMIKALQLFKRERSVVDRERSQGHYSAFEYLLAKLTAELPVDALIGAVS
jgi:ABC-type multidrug transport system ATPase subunit